MRSTSIVVAAAAMALGMAAQPDVYEVHARPMPERRRRRAPEPAPAAPHAAKFIGDGFDAERIARAEWKRARKAERLAKASPSPVRGEL